MSFDKPVPSDYQLPLNAIPLLVQLGLTYRCNLKCDHCYALYRRDLNEFTTAEAIKLIDELYELGSAALVYSHGENLIRRDFFEVAEHLRDRAFYQTLMTNAYYIRTPADAAKIRDCGINRTLISLDSVRPEVHDQKRGSKGAYEVAVAGSRRLLEAGVSTVGFSTTLDVHNYGEVRQIAELAESLGLHAVSFMQNRYNRPGVFDRALWQQYQDVCKGLYELMLEFRGRVDIYTHDPFMLSLLDDRLEDPNARADFIGANICNVATGMISIDPVGNVTGCNFIEEVIGNVREEPVAAIWDRLVHRYSDSEEPPDGPCSGCSDKPGCMGGCKAFHYNGKYDERCGEQRFGHPEPHGVSARPLPMYPTAPLSQKAGSFKGKLPILQEGKVSG